MSTSEDTEFNAWLSSMVREHGEFTVLVVLTDIGERSVTPLCSTYFHVIGDEVDWDDITTMFAGSGQDWKGAAFFPTKARDGGPIDNPTARLRLKELEAGVAANRMLLNDGHFFDTLGRRIKIEPEDAA
ncbi:MAG: hypothetical protein NW223_10620 [Hyphomicrobiaceae bacterium]|nr:hypothetical protein [Hyphomicrobiaceae bacterium]